MLLQASPLLEPAISVARRQPRRFFLAASRPFRQRSSRLVETVLTASTSAGVACTKDDARRFIKVVEKAARKRRNQIYCIEQVDVEAVGRLTQVVLMTNRNDPWACAAKAAREEINRSCLLTTRGLTLAYTTIRPVTTATMSAAEWPALVLVRNG